MKTLLTLFVLLFSCTVVADDNLTDKKIFCKKITDVKIRLLGLHFLKDNEVLIYTFQENQKLGTDRKKYKTNMITITIHENNSTIMTIARKSLKINYYPSSNWDFKSKYCSIVDDLFIHIFNNEIKKITDKNLL